MPRSGRATGRRGGSRPVHACRSRARTPVQRPDDVGQDRRADGTVGGDDVFVPADRSSSIVRWWFASTRTRWRGQIRRRLPPTDPSPSRLRRARASRRIRHGRPACPRFLRIYGHLVRKLSAAHRIDERLVHAVIAVESAYQPRARSPKGARGLMQLMPATARQYGVGNAYNPTANLEGGISPSAVAARSLRAVAGAGGVQRRRSRRPSVRWHAAISGDAGLRGQGPRAGRVAADSTALTGRQPARPVQTLGHRSSGTAGLRQSAILRRLDGIIA